MAMEALAIHDAVQLTLERGYHLVEIGSEG
jgi:hypothetical protein